MFHIQPNKTQDGTKLLPSLRRHYPDQVPETWLVSMGIFSALISSAEAAKAPLVRREDK